MIRFLQISLLMLISILLGTLTAFACHEGDFTALSKGHYKWGKSAGLLQYTENITISSSTSTSCDMYTHMAAIRFDSGTSSPRVRRTPRGNCQIFRLYRTSNRNFQGGISAKLSNVI